MRTLVSDLLWELHAAEEGMGAGVGAQVGGALVTQADMYAVRYRGFTLSTTTVPVTMMNLWLSLSRK